jgi:hypothetical protein
VVAPRLKLALAHAVDYAAGPPPGDAHVLLSVPDSVAARSLARLDVSLERVQAALADNPAGPA